MDPDLGSLRQGAWRWAGANHGEVLPRCGKLCEACRARPASPRQRVLSDPAWLQLPRDANDEASILISEYSGAGLPHPLFVATATHSPARAGGPSSPFGDAWRPDVSGVTPSVLGQREADRSHLASRSRTARILHL